MASNSEVGLRTNVEFASALGNNRMEPAAAGEDGKPMQLQQTLLPPYLPLEAPVAGTEQEIRIRPNPAFDRLVMEAADLAHLLPEQHVVELLTAIQRGTSPIARAVRSRVQTPDLMHQDKNADDAVQEHRACPVPMLDVDRAHVEHTKVTKEAILAVLTERSRGDMMHLEQEGNRLLEQLEPESRSDLASLLAGLCPTSPIASLLFSAMLEARLEGSVAGVDLMHQDKNADDAVQEHGAKRSVPMLDVDRAHVEHTKVTKEAILAVLTERSRGDMMHLEQEGNRLLEQLEPESRSDLASLLAGLCPTSPIASLLFSAMLEARLEGSVAEVRDAKFVEGTQPQTQNTEPRRRLRASPRTKAVGEFVESAFEFVISDMVRQEVAELCHGNLRNYISEWSRRINESKEAVKELQELISHQERANALLVDNFTDEGGVDESSSAQPDTYYTIKLCEQGDITVLIGSVKIEAATKWDGFREVVKEHLGYDISSIRYDDDFGPKQSKDIFCSNKTEWKELRDMMEEDKEEIGDVLTVEVFKEIKHDTGGYRLKMQPGEQGVSIDLEDLREMLITCSSDLQSAQKALLECKHRLKVSWKYFSDIEDKSLRCVQDSVRASSIRRKWVQTRELVFFAAQILRPQITRHFLSKRWKQRHIISAIKLQCVLRSRKARKVAYIATVELAATEMLQKVAMGVIFSVAEEYRAIHKEWIIVDATNAARDFQVLEICS